jgi:sulfonate transport system substrate-binding protein
MTKRLRSLAALVLVPILLAACGGGGDSDEPSAAPETSTVATESDSDVDLSGVTLHVGDQVNISKTLLETSGQIEGTPYNIEWTSFAAGPPLLEAINAGAVDIGGVGDTPPIFAQAGGTDFKIVAASARANEGQSSSAIVVPDGSDIESLADLAGKKVAFTQGSAAHYLLLRALEEGDLAYDDIKPAPLLPPDALAAFTGGDVDAWAVWDPFVALAEEQGAKIIASGADLVPGFGFQVARTGALDDPAVSEAIGDYLERLSAASKWAVDHRDEWAAKYAELTGLSEDVVAKTLERFQSVYLPITDDVIASQQEEADLFTEEGLIPKAIVVADVFDDRYADRFGAS